MIAIEGKSNRIRNLSGSDGLLRRVTQTGARLRGRLENLPPVERAAFFCAIDQEREARDLAVAPLCLEAGVSQPHYYNLRAACGRGVTARFLLSLVRALRTLTTARPIPPGAPQPMIEAAYHGCLAVACTITQTDLHAARYQLARDGEFTGDTAWLAASRARALALYLASTEIGLRQFQLAPCVHLSPAAICYALRKVEAQRDDDTFDAAVEKAAGMVRGRE